jgi:HSP20 family protein
MGLRRRKIMGEATAIKRAEEPIKAVKIVSLLDQMEDTFNAISRRAFEMFEREGRTLGHDLEHWFKAEKELLHTVSLTLTECDDRFEVEAEVPGFSEKDLDINVEPRRLTIAGKRESKKEEKKGKTIYAESSSDQILRICDLPSEIATGKAISTLKNGVLQVTLPKVVKAEAVRIHPKAA